MIKLVIEEIPPSNNKYLGRGGQKTHHAYSAEKTKWELLIKVAALGVKKAQLAGVVVRIVYYFPTKTRRDPDNYSGKFILDGLVKCGVLRDDNFGCIDLQLEGRWDKERPRTEIEILAKE